MKSEVYKEKVNTRDELVARINLYAPRFLYIGQAFRYSPEKAF